MSKKGNIKDDLASGSSALDLAISNRQNGGLPVGRIIEITGMEASGKTLLASHILANTQKLGGLAVFIDTENSINVDFLEAIGVDLSKLLYIQMETIEDIFSTMESIIIKIRESSNDRLVTIVVDSVAASSTKVEMEADFNKDGWATSKAIIMSKGMRKLTNLIGRERILVIFTNQLRQKLGVMFGDPWTTSGGKALQFHASCRLRMKAIGQIKTKDGKDIIGVKIQVQVVKNRFGPPLRKVEFDIFFDSGIDDYGSWLTVLKNFGYVKNSGAWYTYITKNGNEIKFQSKDFKEKMLGDDELKTEVYEKMAGAMIMSYKTKKIGIDDIEISDEPVPEG